MSDPIARLNAALEGRYTIERELGEGGMATVYLADDLKHERKVALKVLKPELAAVVGAERFLAEIKVTANLQHPHILPLFDSGEADGFLFYVMPYVEGETLRDRIDREKQLPVDEAVALASKVAGALQHAHEHSVIHRDIKPGNILLQGGEPVVSDFGIALAVGAAGSNRLTETGLSLGTPYYMSPEQATGDQFVGASTDTYALGSVLYEMLVGEPPYPGTTAQAVLGKIISGKPVSATEQRPSIPANVDAAVRKALEKLPADRFTSAQDFVSALGDSGFRYGEPATTAAGVTADAGPWNRLAIAMTTLAALFAVAFTWSLLGPAPAPLNSPKRFEIGLGPTEPIPVLEVHVLPVLSPDGTQLVYSANLGDGITRLYVRSIDQLDARELAGTDNAYAPFFSPNGQWVGFLDPVERQLKKVSVRGGQPLTLGDTGVPMGGTWLEDGTIIFTSQPPGPATSTAPPSLYRVPDSGGTPEQLTTVDLANGELLHAFPEVLPGGEAVLFTTFTGTGPADLSEGRVMALSLETGEQRTLVDVGYDARYSPTGHLVFARQGALWAVPFDLDRLETTGQEVVVLQGIEMSPVAVPYSFSPDGLLVYMPGEAGVLLEGTVGIPRTLVWVDRQGDEEPLPLPVRMYAGPRLSPDGGRVAASIFDGESWDMWVYDVRSGAALRLTHEGGSNAMVPIWTPNGERIVFMSLDPATGFGNLFWIPSDGSGASEQLVTSDVSDASTSVSPDGRTLIFTRILAPGPNQRREIWEVPLEGERTPAPLLQGQFAYGNASISPDGRWLAYRSDESGDFEIYLQPYPGPGPKTPISIGGGEGAVWSSDGSEIFYRAGLNMMAVEIQTEPTLTVGEPRALFESRHFFTPGAARQYHVAPDGRFLMIGFGGIVTSDDRTEHDHLIVVENWLDELQRLVPSN